MKPHIPSGFLAALPIQKKPPVRRVLTGKNRSRHEQFSLADAVRWPLEYSPRHVWSTPAISDLAAVRRPDRKLVRLGQHDRAIAAKITYHHPIWTREGDSLSIRRDLWIQPSRNEFDILDRSGLPTFAVKISKLVFSLPLALPHDHAVR